MPTIRSTSAPTAAVSTSSRAHPQVRLLLGLRCMSTAVTVEAISTDMSVSMWPASTSSASDPVTMALTTSAMNNVEVSPNDIMSLFWCSAPLAAVVASTPAWLCAMMGFLSSSLVRSAAIETASQYHFQSSQNAGNPSPKAGVSKFYRQSSGSPLPCQ